jgi:hypothetical protein
MSTPEKPKKTGFYQDPVDAAYMRAAFLRTRGEEMWDSLSEFITAAVNAQVRELEAKYNNGEHWEPVEPRAIRTGPPVGRRRHDDD